MLSSPPPSSVQGAPIEGNLSNMNFNCMQRQKCVLFLSLTKKAKAAKGPERDLGSHLRVKMLKVHFFSSDSWHFGSGPCT